MHMKIHTCPPPTRMGAVHLRGAAAQAVTVLQHAVHPDHKHNCALPPFTYDCASAVHPSHASNSAAPPFTYDCASAVHPSHACNSATLPCIYDCAFAVHPSSACNSAVPPCIYDRASAVHPSRAKCDLLEQHGGDVDDYCAHDFLNGSIDGYDVMRPVEALGEVCF
eukprot:1153388-Pelagomonas_calceolata.AAC.3